MQTPTPTPWLRDDNIVFPIFHEGKPDDSIYFTVRLAHFITLTLILEHICIITSWLITLFITTLIWHLIVFTTIITLSYIPLWHMTHDWVASTTIPNTKKNTIRKQLSSLSWRVELQKGRTPKRDKSEDAGGTYRQNTSPTAWGRHHKTHSTKEITAPWSLSLNRWTVEWPQRVEVGEVRKSLFALNHKV